MERSAAEFPILIAQSGPLNGQRWIIRQALVSAATPHAKSSSRTGRYRDIMPA